MATAIPIPNIRYENEYVKSTHHYSSTLYVPADWYSEVEDSQSDRSAVVSEEICDDRWSNCTVARLSNTDECSH